MSALPAYARGVPCPPDDPPSIYDDVENVAEVLSDKWSLPDFLAYALADVAMAGWKPEAWAEVLRDVRRHVEPVLEEANR